MAIKRITTNLIKDSDIATVDIANNAITAAKITDGNITTAKLADLNVTAGKLAATLDLTGKTITVATATTGDSDTSPASTAFVQQEIAALVDSSPSSLNTLNELAAALGDDASFSTTVTNSIATKLPLAGGTMSGPITMSQSGALHNQFTSTGSSSKISIISADGEQAYINYSGATNEMSAGYDRTSSSFRFTNNDTLSSAIRMQINSTGNVGIGTINPQGTFVVSNSGAGGFEFTPDTTSLGVANTNYIASYDRSASAYRDIVIDLGGAESQAVRFKAGGNVGIGTSSPVAKLDIRMSDSNGAYGRGRDGNLNLENTNTSVTEGGWLSISGYMGNTASGGQYPMAYISGGKQTTAADGDYGGYLTLWTISSGANGEANSGGYERMRIDSSGDVLIGQTSQTGYAFAQKLVVGDGDNNDGITIQSGSTHQGNLAFNHSDGTTAHGRISYQHNSNYMQFFTNNTERMRITSNGGIEAATTEAKCLQLNSTHSNGPYLSFQESGSTKFYIGKRSAVGGTSGTGYDLYAAGNYDIAFYTNAARRWSINTSGHLVPENQHTYDIGGTNAEVRNIYAQGISFASNANASGMTSELLDDYEEGTWTPTAGFTLTINSTCRYTKVGGVVTVTFDVTYATGTDGSYGRLESLPFSSYDYSTGTIGFDTATNRVTMSYSAGTYLYLLNATTNAYLSLTDMSGIRVIGSCTYLTNQ